VIVFFLFVTFIWWFQTKRKLDLTKKIFTQILIREKFVFPKDRSLVVRGYGFFEEELSSLYHCSIQLSVPLEVVSPGEKRNFLLPLSELLLGFSREGEKNFVCQESLLNSKELNALLSTQEHKKRIHFLFQNEKWTVEISHG
jgi:hypothetical protein